VKIEIKSKSDYLQKTNRTQSKFTNYNRNVTSIFVPFFATMAQKTTNMYHASDV